MKKFLVLLLTMVMAFSVGIVLGACNGGGHTHSYKSEWSYDQNYHWHDCTGSTCLEVSDKAEHQWTGETERTCSVCGKVYQENGGNNGGAVDQDTWEGLTIQTKFDNVTFLMEGEFSDGEQIGYCFKLAGADCSQIIDDVEYKQEEGTAEQVREIFIRTAMAMLDNYQDFTFNSDTNAYVNNNNIVYAITVFDYDATITVSNVSLILDQNNNIISLSCDMMQEFVAYGTPMTYILDITFTFTNYGTTEVGGIIGGEEGGDDDEHQCNVELTLSYDEHTHYYKCSDTECDLVYGQEAHDFDQLKYDSEGHWLECVCGYAQTKEGHKGGTATCTELAKCEVCNQEYGALKNHEHTELKFDADGHWLECVCGDADIKEGHKGGTATCTELAKCEVCKQEYGTLKNHEHTEVKYDEEGHWSECVCGDTTTKEEHQLTKDGDMLVCEDCEFSKEDDTLPEGAVTSEQWANAVKEETFNNFAFNNTLVRSSMTQAEKVLMVNNLMAVQMSEIRNVFTEEYNYYYDDELGYKASYLALFEAFLSDSSKYIFDDVQKAYLSTEELSVTTVTNGYTQYFALKAGAIVKFSADGFLSTVEGKMSTYSGGTYNTELYWEFSNFGTTEIILPSAEPSVPDLEFGQVDLEKLQELLLVKEDNVQFANGKTFDDKGRLSSYAEDTAVYSGNILKNGDYEYISKEGNSYYQYTIDSKGQWNRTKYEHIYDPDDFYRESDFRLEYEEDVKNVKYNAETGLYELDYTEYFSYYGPCKNIKFGFVEGKLRYFYFEREYESGSSSAIHVEKVEQFIDYRTENLVLPEVDRLSPSIPSKNYGFINENAWANAMKNQVYSHSMERVTTVCKDGKFVSETVETILVEAVGSGVGARIQIGEDAYYLRDSSGCYSILLNDNGEWVKTRITEEAFNRVYGTGHLQGYYAFSVYDQVSIDYMSMLYKADTLTSQYGDVYNNFMIGFVSSRIEYLCHTQTIDGYTIMTQYYVTYQQVSVTLPTDFIEAV